MKSVFILKYTGFKLIRLCPSQHNIWVKWGLASLSGSQIGKWVTLSGLRVGMCFWTSATLWEFISIVASLGRAGLTEF